jgi:hypothetical protein
MHRVESNIELPCEERDFDGVSFPPSLSPVFPLLPFLCLSSSPLPPSLPSNTSALTTHLQIIPRPKTLTDYESRDFEDDIPVFSSFIYLIDLVRISGYLYSLESDPTQDLEGAVKNADHMLLSWRLCLPREKQGVVGSDGEVDEILFQAHSLLQR